MLTPHDPLRTLATVASAGLLAWLTATTTFAADPAAGVRLLSEFGPLSTPDQADATLEKASQQMIAAGGGVLVIPTNAPSTWMPSNTSQGVWRKPEPPAPAKGWGSAPSVTIIDCRQGALKVLVPELSGLPLSRSFVLSENQSGTPDSVYPMLGLHNEIIRGTAEYSGALLEPVQPGHAQRCYVASLRGLFPGLTLHADEPTPARLQVKSLGYDRPSHRFYFVADTPVPVPAGAVLTAASGAAAVGINTFSQTENQTFDIFNQHYDYAPGDATMYCGRLDYLGDGSAGPSNRPSVIYNGEVRSELNPFRGRVAAWDPATRTLTYTDAQNAHTLASGRPIVNLNPSKIITNGTLTVAGPGGAMLGWAGSIRSADAPWTADVVGCYLAIDEPSEYVPGTDHVRRWWYITALGERDGVKSLSIQRHFWGAKNNSSITRLYNPANFTYDAHRPRLLHYIIARGANVEDVSRGVRAGSEYHAGAAARQVRLDPGPYVGTAADFAPGDPIEQAIGPDPYLPVVFRSWLWDNVPGILPSPVFDIANDGAVARDSVMAVHGGSPRLADYKTGTPQVPWNTVVSTDSASENGVVFRGPVDHAAFLFQQPAAAQPIRWATRGGQSQLIVSAAGNLELNTTAVDLSDQGLTATAGLSAASPGNARAANRKGEAPAEPGHGLAAQSAQSTNLRGIKIPVPAGQTRFEVTLPFAELSAEYGAFVRPSWLSHHAVSQQTQQGFTVQFDRPAPNGATLDWMIVR